MFKKKESPPRVGMFMKVSYQEYENAIKDCLDYHFINENGEEVTHTLDETEIKNLYDAIQLPTRATSGSSGYDIRVPVNIRLKAGMTIKVPLGLRVKIKDGWWFGVFPRSSLGFKYRLQLDNTVGVVDSDYFYSDNEGHMYLQVTNDSKDGTEMILEKGKAICQGVFIPYGITFNDCADGVRNGGFGSTD